MDSKLSIPTFLGDRWGVITDLYCSVFIYITPSHVFFTIVISIIMLFILSTPLFTFALGETLPPLVFTDGHFFYLSKFIKLKAGANRKNGEGGSSNYKGKGKA